MPVSTNTPEGFRQNAMGHLVPEDRISAIDKLRDDVVLGIVAKAKAHREQLIAFKLSAMTEISDFVDLSAAEYGVNYGGTKGNVTLTSFDGRYKLVRAVGEHRVFDERVQAAKALIDQCINKWTDGARSELRALVEHSFRVNKQGHIDVNSVISLRQLDIADPEWREAMDAIADAIQVNGTSIYMRLYERHGDGRYVQIALDPARL